MQTVIDSMTGTLSINIASGLYYKIFLRFLMQFICKGLLYHLYYYFNYFSAPGKCKYVYILYNTNAKKLKNEF